MRTIKFRAWDSANAKMIQVKQLTQTPERYLNNGELKYFDYPLMQYTGLKDKNGKEIYEGDVVKDKVLNTKTRKPEDITRVFEVYWDEETASFWQRLVGDTEHCFRSGTNFAAEKDCEVIGNVYSNPELIKERQTEGKK